MILFMTISNVPLHVLLYLKKKLSTQKNGATINAMQGNTYIKIKFVEIAVLLLL